MTSICFYFQVHQPYRTRRFTYFDSSAEHRYLDDEANRSIMEKVARKCYLPANELMLRLIHRHAGAFKVAYSITGVALEQLEVYAPDALESFVRLADTGCVEFLAETYHHSLASVFDDSEFVQQIDLHTAAIRKHFGQSPRVFRNTELIYDDRIGRRVADLGFRGVIAEGADDVLDWRSPNYLYNVAGRECALLLKNYRLSDDIAFRFSNESWDDFPLTAEKYSKWLHRISGDGEIVNLFMDYETFGEHQWEHTGIFEFMEHLPDYVMRHQDWEFATPSEIIDRRPPVAELPFYRLTSWADLERDLTAWNGNSMQKKALDSLYGLAADVYACNDWKILDTFRRLQTSDHFYYMCTKWFADGDVHAYFSPFESPYDAYLNYMNVLKDFRRVVEHRVAELRLEASTPRSAARPASARTGG